MKVKSKIWIAIVGVSLFFGISGNVAAKMPVTQADRLNIEQPFPLKVAVTLGGFSLIGLELWWFIFSKRRTKKS